MKNGQLSDESGIVNLLRYDYNYFYLEFDHDTIELDTQYISNESKVLHRIQMNISDKYQLIERECYDLFELLGDVGGMLAII